LRVKNLASLIDTLSNLPYLASSVLREDISTGDKQEKGAVQIQVPAGTDRIELGIKIRQFLLEKKILDPTIPPPKNRDGYKEFKVNKNHKIYIKPAGSVNLLVPSKINSGGKSLSNRWVELSTVIPLVQSYIKTLKLTKSETQLINDLLAECSNSSYSIPYTSNKKLITPEFYEVLSAIKFGYLLMNNDSKIKRILRLPNTIKVKTIHIFLPLESNYPLTDYEISINNIHATKPSKSDKNKRSTLKISVKSKVESSKANTVKFTDLFDNGMKVDEWVKTYKNLGGNKDQFVQATLAKEAVSAGRGKKTYYPISALGKTSSRINDNLLNGALKTIISNKIAPKNYLVQDVQAIIDPKFFNLTEKEYSLLTEFIVKSFPKTPNIKLTYVNLLVSVEKVFQRNSQKAVGNENLNFYQMFYDAVLKEKSIIYAVSSKSGTRVNFNFYSLINWAEEYHTWLALRTQNYPDHTTSSLGIDV
jgi:hypothetical protein